MISGVKWSPQWRTPRKSTIFRNLQKIGEGTYRVVFKSRDNITDLFVALKKIQKREITIFCVKLGHINDLSTRVGSEISDWPQKGLENNHQVKISSQISPTERLTPKKGNCEIYSRGKS